MGFTASFLMALALSVDALVCAVITGKKQFPPALRLRFALEMGLTFGLFQALMPIAGFYAGASLAALIAAFDHWAAFALLSVVGFSLSLKPPSDTSAKLLPISLATCSASSPVTK